MSLTVAFVASKLDPAANNMISILRDLFGSDEFEVGVHSAFISAIDGSVLYARTPEDLGASGADALLILSRHSGTPGTPVITAHVSGNFGEAMFGGRPREISKAMPSFMKAFLLEAAGKSGELGYAVALEPTHHGPSLSAPLAFVEVGSKEENWMDRRACELVVRSALSALKQRWEFVPAIAFGGQHINQKFTQIELLTEYALGHVVRKYDVDSVDEEMVRAGIQRSLEEPRVAIVDWKGLRSSQKERLLPILGSLGLEVLKARSLLRGKRG